MVFLLRLLAVAAWFYSGSVSLLPPFPAVALWFYFDSIVFRLGLPAVALWFYLSSVVQEMDRATEGHRC